MKRVTVTLTLLALILSTCTIAEAGRRRGRDRERQQTKRRKTDDRSKGRIFDQSKWRNGTAGSNRQGQQKAKPFIPPNPSAKPKRPSDNKRRPHWKHPRQGRPDWSRPSRPSKPVHPPVYTLPVVPNPGGDVNNPGRGRFQPKFPINRRPGRSRDDRRFKPSRPPVYTLPVVPKPGPVVTNPGGVRIQPRPPVQKRPAPQPIIPGIQLPPVQLPQVKLPPVALPKVSLPQIPVFKQPNSGAVSQSADPVEQGIRDFIKEFKPVPPKSAEPLDQAVGGLAAGADLIMKFSGKQALLNTTADVVSRDENADPIVRGIAKGIDFGLDTIDIPGQVVGTIAKHPETVTGPINDRLNKITNPSTLTPQDLATFVNPHSLHQEIAGNVLGQAATDRVAEFDDLITGNWLQPK